MYRRYLLFYFLFCFCYLYTNSSEVHFLQPYKYFTTINKSITLNWTKYELCNKYNVEVSTNLDFTNVVYSNVIDNENSLTISVSNSGIYYIRIKPICSNNWSSASITVIDKFSYRPIVENWFASDSNITINSGRVSSWGDYIDFSRTGVQNTNANRPILSPNERFINNSNAVFFRPQTTRSNLSLNKRIALKEYTIIALYQFLNNNNSQSQILLGENSNGFFVEYDNPLRGFGILSINNSNSPEFMFCDKSFIDTVFSLNTITKRKLMKNQISLPINGSISDSFRYSNIGSRVDFSDVTSFQGKVAEFIVFNKELSESEITLFHNYLYTKYAPPVNLGNDTVIGSSFSDSIVLNASNRFIKYKWTTGDTTQIIKVATFGTYGVWTTDVFGQTSYDEVRVAPYNRLNNDTVYICEGSSININLNINSSLFNVKWLDNNSNNIVRNFSQEGTYIVEITDLFNKTIFDTVNVLFDKFSFNRILNGNELNACLNDTLKVLASTAIDTLHWSNNTSINAYQVTQNEQVIVFAQSYTGCLYKDTFNINIVGEKPYVDFEIGNILCEKQAVQFTDASFPPFGNYISNWDWSFSDTTSAIDQNPQKIFQTDGNKTATLKVTTNAGCFNQISKPLVLNKKPRALFDNLLSCAGNPTQFRDFSIPNADSIYQWNWNFNNIATSNQKNPTFEFPNTGLYHVLLKATNTNNCFDTLTKPVGVNISPTANFTSDSIACANSIITFNNTSTAQFPLAITAFNWSFGDGAQDNLLNNTSHVYATNGSYNVTLAVRANNQCIDSITKKINVYNTPNVDFNISNNKCIGQPIQFSDASTLTDNTFMNSWTWLFGGIGTSNQQNPTFTFNEQGNYTIQLNATSNKGCSGTKVKSVTVTQPPTVDFSFTPTYGLPPLNVSFNNLSPLGATFTWNFGDGSANFIGQNPPVHTYNSIGNYPIQLSATNFLGCTNTVTKYILVDVANIDAELSSITILQNGDYYKALMSIKNNSNIPIYNLGLTIRLGNGTLIRETWNGVLLPNQTLNYTFVSELRYNGTNNIPIICANIESVNFNASENNTQNNNSCKDFKVGEFDILSVYPNPASSNVNVGIMVPEAGTVQLKLYNYIGQEVIYLDYNATKGYNIVPIDLSLLRAAQYIIHAKYNDKVVNRFVLKK